MKIRRLIVLLPCYSLEDLSLRQKPADAEQLLAAWTVGYHPSILAAVGKVPCWTQADHPDEEPDHLDGAVVLVPRESEKRTPEAWFETAEKGGSTLIRDFTGLDDLTPRLLELLDPPEAPFLPPERVDPERVADLRALGMGYLLTELLTRQLRYMSSLDETQFDTTALCAAEAILRGDAESAAERLQAGFDLLTESREYFYPVEGLLLDLTLVARSTLGEPLRRELAGQGPMNLLLSGETLDACAQGDPETMTALQKGLADERVQVIGGEFLETPLPLMTREGTLANLRRGLETFDRLLKVRPKIFGRRRFGLAPFLPGLLKQLGFEGALHITIGEGRIPESNQSKISWDGHGQTAIEALARVPLDGSKTAPFFRLPERLGDSLDFDHASTLVFAHWPSMACRWYDLFKRIDRYSPSLGRFISVEQYFEDTVGSGQSAEYTADDYRSPYLEQAVDEGVADPISRWARYYRREAALETIRTLDFFAQVIDGERGSGKDWSDDAVALESLARTVEGRVLDPSGEPIDARKEPESVEFDDEIDGRLSVSAARLASTIAPETKGETAEETGEVGELCLNPGALTEKKVLLEGSGNGPTADVPAFGFAWIGSDATDQSEAPGHARKTDKKEKSSAGWKRLFGAKKIKQEPPLAERVVEKERTTFRLRNEFFEAAIDPITGAVRAIHDYTHRANRLAEQIAMRLPRSRRPATDDDDEAAYTVMAADRIEIDSAGPNVGRLTIEGRLVDRQTGTAVARFEKRLTARRGSRVLEMDVQITPDWMPEGNPWDSYYGVRFAWGDATADLVRDVQLAGEPTEAVRLESAHRVEIRSEKFQTTILPGGLPYHRRFGLRKMDTLLVVPGERARRFRLGIGIDLPSSSRSAMAFFGPELPVFPVVCPKSQSGVFFHFNRRNVVATRWEPTVEEDGRVSGFRVRLLETEGKTTELGIDPFRPVGSAVRTDFLGMPESEPLAVENEGVKVPLRPYEWVQIEAKWET